VKYLSDSRDVASTHITILRRAFPIVYARCATNIFCIGFDNIFLAMVESIKTDQDRLDVIAELQQFIVRHDFPL
jgi:hypothetical protein